MMHTIDCRGSALDDIYRFGLDNILELLGTGTLDSNRSRTRCTC